MPLTLNTTFNKKNHISKQLDGHGEVLPDYLAYLVNPWKYALSIVRIAIPAGVSEEYCHSSIHLPLIFERHLVYADTMCFTSNSSVSYHFARYKF